MLEDLIKDPVQAEIRRGETLEDEAEGRELDYSPFSSPLPSLTPSPQASVAPSPASSRRPSVSLASPPPMTNKKRNAKRSRRSKRAKPVIAETSLSPPPSLNPHAPSSGLQDGKRKRPSSPPIPVSPKIPLHKKSRNHKANIRSRQRRKNDPEALLKHGKATLQHSVDYLPTEFVAEDLNTSRPCFVGKHYEVEKGCHPLSYYTDRGFKVVEWDGK